MTREQKKIVAHLCYRAMQFGDIELLGSMALEDALRLVDAPAGLGQADWLLRYCDTPSDYTEWNRSIG